MADPMTSQDTIAHYEREYYSGHDGVASTSSYGQGEQFRITEANDRLDKLNSVDSLLDVGCGMGFFVKAASERGINAVGIDISQQAVTHGQTEGLDIRLGDLLFLDEFSIESFDVITMWASIEHLFLPKETLQKAHTLLKPNGVIVVETGNINSYLARIFKSKWRIIESDHNFYFASSTLDDLLDRTGFDIIRTENDGFVESMIFQFGLSDFIMNKFTQSSLNARQRSSSLKQKINKAASRLQLGDVMIKYARKKA
jgi:2-polyprenyl-3-methyl-5-hydroxy-6-metoxy-1,4-benzoquinol methylase